MPRFRAPQRLRVLGCDELEEVDRLRLVRPCRPRSRCRRRTRRSGHPAPPVTAGNGNQPRFHSCPSCCRELEAIVPGAHWPMSIIDAFPSPSAAASLPAPSHGRREEAFLERLLGDRDARSSLPAWTKLGSAPVTGRDGLVHGLVAAGRGSRGRPTRTSPSTCRAAAERPSGCTPAVLSLPTSARSSSHVAGGAVIPALSKWSLLYQKPTMPRSNGMPYCLPSSCVHPHGAGVHLSFHDATSAVMSLRRPASDLLGHARRRPTTGTGRARSRPGAGTGASA